MPPHQFVTAPYVILLLLCSVCVHMYVSSYRQAAEICSFDAHKLSHFLPALLPGGDANLAFREDEELKPYKKKSRASLYSASLDDDEPFTIPAWKNDDSQGQQGNDTPQAAATISSMQPETSLDTTSSHVWHPDTDLQDDTADASIPLHGHCSAARPSVADTASQTSPGNCR